MATVAPPVIMTFHLAESIWPSSKSSQKRPAHSPFASPASIVASSPASRIGGPRSALASWIPGVEPPFDPPVALPPLPEPPSAPPVPCPPAPPDPDDEPTAGPEASLDASTAIVGPQVFSRLHPVLATHPHTAAASDRVTAAVLRAVATNTYGFAVSP